MFSEIVIIFVKLQAAVKPSADVVVAFKFRAVCKPLMLAKEIVSAEIDTQLVTLEF